MHEGMFSLMQMAKTCGASYHGRKNSLHQRIDGSYHGRCHGELCVGDLVSQSRARVLVLPGLVIKDTTKAELPPGFQTAELCAITV